MRAVVCRAGELTVEEVPTPEPGPGQVLIRVLRAGICGSDLHARVHCDATAQVSDEVGYDAFMRSDESVIMGHEFVGEVVSYGPGCRKRWSPGTRVVAVPMIRHGEKAHLTGLSASAAGAYAQFTLVSEDMTFEVPAGMPVEHAAVTEPLAVAHHAVRRSDIGRRDVAVVVGCGPIGLAVIAMLKAAGVRTVIASDLSAGRRGLAARVGADIVVDPASSSPFERCAQAGKYITEAQDLLGAAFDGMRTLRRIPLVPWDSLFRVADALGATPKGPVVFECVGTPGMIEHVVTAAPFRSRIVVVGVCMEPDVFRPAMAINKEHELRFVFCYDPAEYHETLRMIADGKVDVGPMITATIGLDGVAAAFDALGSAEHHAKVLIDPMSEIASL
ncbi:zinc-binding dehydrogenase [Gordonia aurantiaca]|uniref:zinc-binding dehydrogenase n=1 Tax=Gordonia sp. B21 TaxID=3151852 RepID=UPI0032660C47